MQAADSTDGCGTVAHARCTKSRRSIQRKALRFANVRRVVYPPRVFRKIMHRVCLRCHHRRRLTLLRIFRKIIASPLTSRDRCDLARALRATSPPGPLGNSGAKLDGGKPQMPEGQQKEVVKPSHFSKPETALKPEQIALRAASALSAQQQ